MVDEIRIYAEGGGDWRDTKARLRQGLAIFLKDLVDLARGKRIRWSVVACGPRSAAYDNFLTALTTHPEAFNVLLVDSEGPVTTGPKKHLEDRDGWSLEGVEDEQCHLMVQAMEAWLVADIDALRAFYGRGFNPNPIPKNPNVEQIDKNVVESALRKASRDTTKREYHKARHVPLILELLDVPRVRKAAPFCNRLFDTLERSLSAP